MANLDHLSYSSISSYLLCGHAWKARYIDHVQTPTAPALVTGSAFHGVAEAYIQKHTDNLDEAWELSWAHQLERNSPVAWEEPTQQEALRGEGLRMVRAKPVQKLLAEIRANYDPATCAMEKRVELRVPGVPVPIVGYIDVITRDGVPGDFKTAARMWAAGKADEELQPLFYLAALSQEGIAVPDWTFRHYVISKTLHPDAKTFEVRRRPSEFFWLFDMIYQAWHGINVGAFPMNPSTWKCSPKYCELWAQCRAKYAPQAVTT